MSLQLSSIPAQVRNLADNLPPDVSWDDVLDAVLTCRSIARGLADMEAGRTIPAEEVKAYLAQRRQAHETTVEQ